MLTFMWFVLIAMMVALCAACDLGKGNRMPGCVSWFALQPFMRESKKAKGRVQQKRKRRR